MSGFLKSVGKVFKKVVKSPIFKVVAIAAAVYFTGGLALGAMGSTFAAALPGIGAAAEGLGITAGAFGAVAEGAATAVGIGGGLAAGMESGLTAAGVAGETSGGVLLGTAGLGESAAAGLGDAASAVGGAAADTSSAALSTAASGAPLGSGSSFALPGQFDAASLGAAQTPGGVAGVTGVNNAIGMTAAKGGGGLMGWYDGLSSGAQKMVLEGMGQGAKAVMGGIAQKNSQDFQQGIIDQQREDTKRKGQTIDMTGTYQTKYKTPGVIASLNGG